MAYDPKNIHLGPCRVRWGGVDLGMTKGGVEVEVSTSTKEVTVDQFGETPVDEYITGRKLSVKCPFAETDLDTLYAIMRNVGANLIDDGAKAAGTITFSANPAANDTVTVNGAVFTFVTVPTLLRQVKIGSTVAASAQNLLNSLQFCTDAGVSAASYSLSGLVITVTYNKTGPDGNAFTMARSGTGPAVSATLTGGVVSTRRRIEMQDGVGTSIRGNANELVLRPIGKADNDFTEDFVVPLAATSGGLTFAYKQDEERLFNLTFMGYPNISSRLLFMYGDKRSS